MKTAPDQFWGNAIHNKYFAGLHYFVQSSNTNIRNNIQMKILEGLHNLGQPLNTNTIHDTLHKLF